MGKVRNNNVIRLRYATGDNRNEAIVKLHRAFDALDDLLTLLILPKPFVSFVQIVSQKIAKQIVLMKEVQK